MIYVASPYSHPDPAVRSGRYYRVLHYAGLLLQRGEVAFSPIVYGHPFALANFTATDHESWQQFNEHMLLVSRMLHVLKMDGWEESKGVQHEMRFASDNDIRCELVDWK